MVVLAFLMTHLISYQRLPFTSDYSFPLVPFSIFVIYGLFICETNCWNYRRLQKKENWRKFELINIWMVIRTNLLACTVIFTLLTIVQMALFQFIMNPFRFVGLLGVCLMISLIETGVFIFYGMTNKSNRPITLNRLARNSGVNQISVVRNNELLKFDESEIAYFKHKNNIIFLVTSDGKEVITQYDSLNEIESTLSNKFFRANRQTIISRDCVLSLQNDINNKVLVRIKNCENPIMVSRYKKRTIKDWLSPE